MCGSPKIDYYCLEGYCLNFSRGKNQPLGYLNTLSRGFLRTRESDLAIGGQRGYSWKQVELRPRGVEEGRMPVKTAAICVLGICICMSCTYISSF